VPVEVAVPPEVVTERGPVVALDGTTTVIVVVFVTVKDGAGTPWKETDCTVTKFVPARVTAVPTLPEEGEKPLIVGGRTITVRVVLAVKPSG
jgi:hypothetical protein